MWAWSGGWPGAVAGGRAGAAPASRPAGARASSRATRAMRGGRRVADVGGLLGLLRDVDDRHGAAVLGPGLLVVAGIDRTLGAVGDGQHPVRLNTQALQVALHRRGAPLAQRDVVLARAALVAVALDGDGNGRELLQPGGLPLQGLAGGVVERGAVVGEVDAVADVDLEVLLGAGLRLVGELGAGHARVRGRSGPDAVGPGRAQGRLLARVVAGAEQKEQAGDPESLEHHAMSRAEETAPGAARWRPAPAPGAGPCPWFLRRRFRNIGSRNQGRPVRIRRVRGRRNLPLVVAADVDGQQPGVVGVRVVTLEQDHPAVRSPARALVHVALREQPLVAAVRLHDADVEQPALDLGEGNQVAARRPGRAAVAAVAEADPLRSAAAARHDV